jgi:hypothetical protein
MPWKTVLKIPTVTSFEDSKGRSEVPVFILFPFSPGRGSSEHNYLIEPSRFVEFILVSLSYLFALFMLCRLTGVKVMG